MPDAHRAETYIKIGETDPKQTHPRPQHMAAIQAAHAGVTSGANRSFGNFIQETADQMAQRMTAERVAAQQDYVQREHDCSDADAEMIRTRCVRKPHRFPRIVRENENEQQREVKEVAVNVLHDERKRIFTEISLSRLTHRTGGRVRPKRFVISAAVVITGEPETGGRPQNQKGWRK